MQLEILWLLAIPMTPLEATLISCWHYSINGFDSYGDGWNGFGLTMTMLQAPWTFDMEDGSANSVFGLLTGAST